MRVLLGTARVLALIGALASGAAAAAPVAYKFTSTYVDGNASIVINGSFTIDSALLAPNLDVFVGSNAGLLAANIVVSAGMTSFSYGLPDIEGYRLQTNAQGKVVGIAFSTNYTGSYFLYALGGALQGFYPPDAESEDEYEVLRSIVVRPVIAAAIPVVPPPLVAVLALALAASALGFPAVRRRLR